jgi:hypothetical protein
MVGKAQKSHGARFELDSMFGGGTPLEHPPYSPALVHVKLHFYVF